MAIVMLKTASVVGTSMPHAWSQVRTIKRGDDTLVVMVSLSYEGDSELVELSTIGGSMLNSISEKGVIDKKDLVLPEEIEASIVVVNCTQMRLDIHGIGRVKVFIQRGANFGVIFEGGNALSKIAGPIFQGDKIAITTSEFVEEIGIKFLSESLTKGRAIAELMAVKVHGKANSSLMACVIGEAVGDEMVAEDRKQNLIIKLTDTVKSWKSKILVAKPLYISEEKRNTNLWIGSILLGLLLIGILVGFARRSTLVKETAYRVLEAGVKQKIEEAKSIGDLNPERAKDLVNQSKDEIEGYKNKTKDEKYLVKADALIKGISEAEVDIFKKQQINFNTLVELTILKNNLAVDKLSLDARGNLMLVDTNSARIVGVSSQDKSVFEISTSTVGKVGELGYFGKKIYAIASGGIAEITNQENKIVIEPDDLWKEVTLLDVFAGNVYLLDRGQSEIWKYPALTDGFGTRKRWLAAGIQPDLSNVIDMKVDGDVWILTRTGKLVRYSRGVPVEFSMEGLPTQEGDTLSNPSSLFITEDEVYILENGAKRVVVFELESGKYKRQYATEELGQGKDLVVYEGKAYVLLDNKIVWFKI